MDPKSAISRAKSYVADMFSDEGLAELGLEEVRFDDNDRTWLITVGFSRPGKFAGALAALSEKRHVFPRSYKVVRLKDSDGELVSITNRKVDD